MKEVIVSDYDPGWIDVYEAVRAWVQPALGDIVVSIEHVGSTSVPGLAAKPVVDIDVVVLNSNLTLGIERLKELGYQHRGDLGIPGREAFRRPVDSPVHHLYLCPSDSPSLANHVAIRDYLRANPVTAEEYGDLKKRLAREHPKDIDSYMEGKTPFLLGILRKAGFGQDALADIQRMNARR